MAQYRLYCLDGAQRIAGAAEMVEGADDDAAIEAARALRKPMACELWQGRRLVAALPAAKPR